MNLKIYPSYFFKVKVLGMAGGETDESFQEITGLSTEIQTETITSGGDNQRVYKVPLKKNHPNLVLKRALLAPNSPLLGWCAETIDGGMFDITPRDIQISLMHPATKAIVMEWKVIKAYPIKYDVSGFNATANELMMESIEFTYQTFETIGAGGALGKMLKKGVSKIQNTVELVKYKIKNTTNAISAAKKDIQDATKSLKETAKSTSDALKDVKNATKEVKDILTGKAIKDALKDTSSTTKDITDTAKQGKDLLTKVKEGASEAQKTTQQTQNEADKAKQSVTPAKDNKLVEEAKRKADEEAKKKKAEEDKKKADEEAKKKKAEEDKKKADEEAKKKKAEEGKKKAASDRVKERQEKAEKKHIENQKKGRNKKGDDKK